ncbi:hypothetical protein F5Y04DRAFT_264969 [Hypomontagnella monticulosa]|nr:hypothetical protein F5Y04DRAFT_264969 [Hypomontagnella monticulosa]
MATPNQDPLQVLDQMFKEILVQTGKQLKTSAKDGPRNSTSVGNEVRSNTSDAMVAYHYALDDLESEITRAKAVILRDLEKLRAARAPAPVPIPLPQPVAPPAPMMELPSSAAHTISTPAFAPKQESKTAAPFPDMGMGMGMGMGMNMSTDIVDLTSGDKKPSPRVQPDAIKPQSRPSPLVKNEVKPSPKQLPKPSPKLSQPPKVTPVPPPQIPQIPRFPPSQPSTVGSAAATQAQRGVPNAQPTRPSQAPPAAQTAPDNTINVMPMSTNVGGGDTNATGGGFTDMQFSLAPPSNKAQAAPPAPMPEFDLTTFAPQDANNNMMSLDNSKPGNSSGGAPAGGNQNTAAVPQQQQPKEPEKTDTNIDDLFNLDNMDNHDGAGDMFDLGNGVNDSTFDDMMYYDDNNADMDQFDEQFFLP